jgi:formylglycine-generating enzyme required for sulfatase activity
MRQILLVLVVSLAGLSCAGDAPPEGVVYIRGGAFDMGVPRGADNPLHRVQVDDFWMAQHEVTAGEWRAFTDEEGGWSHWSSFAFTSFVARNVDFRVPDDWPMYWVSWYQAVRYCNWRSEREGLQAAYVFDPREMGEYLAGRVRSVVTTWNRGANGYRLPTEAEWEYAARGGVVGKGQGYPAGTAVSDVAWYEENSEQEPHPVGRKLPNVLGLYDMLGNVGEWCWDYYRADYYLRSPRQNPGGPDSGYDPENFGVGAREIRVFRGATWMHPADDVTEVFRFRSLATLSAAVGFRLVRSVK